MSAAADNAASSRGSTKPLSLRAMTKELDRISSESGKLFAAAANAGLPLVFKQDYGSLLPLPSSARRDDAGITIISNDAEGTARKAVRACLGELMTVVSTTHAPLVGPYTPKDSADWVNPNAREFDTRKRMVLRLPTAVADMDIIVEGSMLPHTLGRTCEQYLFLRPITAAATHILPSAAKKLSETMFDDEKNERRLWFNIHDRDMGHYRRLIYSCVRVVMMSTDLPQEAEQFALLDSELAASVRHTKYRLVPDAAPGQRLVVATDEDLVSAAAGGVRAPTIISLPDVNGADVRSVLAALAGPSCLGLRLVARALQQNGLLSSMTRGSPTRTLGFDEKLMLLTISRPTDDEWPAREKEEEGDVVDDAEEDEDDGGDCEGDEVGCVMSDGEGGDGGLDGEEEGGDEFFEAV